MGGRHASTGAIVTLPQRLRTYRGVDLRADLTGALVVTTLAIPQGMAYAMLAGLPPQYGIFASIVPALVYAVLGTSSHLTVGPVAITALLVAGGLEPLASPGSPQYIELAMLMSCLVGAMLIALGLLRAGKIVNFLSHPAILGFTAAAAILTAMSQIRGIFGIPVAALEGATITAENPWPILLHLHEGAWLSIAVGGVSLAIMVALKRWAPRVPAAVIVCLGGGVLAWYLGPHPHQLAVVGEIPRALPKLGLSVPTLSQLSSLLGPAATVAVLGFGTSVTVAKAIAAQHRERIRPSRELLALGVANVLGGLTSCFPVSGSLSRSQVSAEAGSRTQLATVMSVGMIVVTVAAITSTFAWLPIPVLAAIIIHGALRLLDFQQSREAIVTKRSDGITLLLTLAATLLWGLVPGLVVGLVVALLLFVIRTAQPHIAELGRIPGTTVYRNVQRFDVETCPQVGILRIDAPLYYANARFLEDRVVQAFTDAPQMRILALECSGVGDLDATALRALRDIVEALRSQGNDLHLIGAIGPVRDLLARSGASVMIGADHMHRTIAEAAPQLMAEISRTYCESSCTVSAFPDCTLIPRSRLARPAADKARFSPQI
jgi:SulP family sulfate permease